MAGGEAVCLFGHGLRNPREAQVKDWGSVRQQTERMADKTVRCPEPREVFVAHCRCAQ